MFLRTFANSKIRRMIQEDDISEIAICLEVDSEVIEQIREGQDTRIVVEINEKNQNRILENIDGHLAMSVEDMPATYHSCFYYNHGVFPYVIKEELEFVGLNGDGGDSCFTKIIGVEVVPGTRFNYHGSDKPIEEDPNGDSCVWEVRFELVPVPIKPKHYLMRWNPAVSSFTKQDYRSCVEHMERGMFKMDWSIYDWQEARRGDFFYMMRVGDDKAGIVFTGQFLSDPYPCNDWDGSSKRKMYVDVVCMNPAGPDEKPRIPLAILQESIPEYEWAKGHSGVRLPQNVAKRMFELWNLDEDDDEEYDDSYDEEYVN